MPIDLCACVALRPQADPAAGKAIHGDGPVMRAGIRCMGCALVTDERVINVRYI